jgi:hypothetical protein
LARESSTTLRPDQLYLDINSDARLRITHDNKPARGETLQETFEGLEFDLILGLIRRVAVENGVNILKTKLEGMFATQI